MILIYRRKIMKKASFLILMMVLSFSATTQESIINPPDAWYAFAFEYETGYTKLLHHTIQFGESGTNFNLITQGGQEILFPFTRLAADIILWKRHTLSFLYQPLTIETETRLFEPVTIDDITFAADQGLLIKYGFPFWRLTYRYNFIENDRFTLGAGLALQLRNASIVFQPQDGTDITVNQNLGPVPALSFYTRYDFPFGLFLALEATGLYASSAFINGADFEFEGSILDASLRTGFRLQRGIEAFISTRFLGGSAKGTSEYETDYWTQGASGYTSNYLATLILSLGVRVN